MNMPALGFEWFAIIAALWGFFIAVLWLFIGWRAMRAHEKLADAAEEYTRRRSNL